jgi:hypothetical protein
MGTEGPFPGAKARPGRDADHSPPFSAEVEMSSAFVVCSGTAFFLVLNALLFYVLCCIKLGYIRVG